MLCLAGERVGRRLACLGAITVAKVELQTRQKGREPAAGDQQMPVLGEGDPALEELGEEAQALLHARDQHARCRGRILAAEPVHRPIDHLERAAPEVGCFRLPGELQHIGHVRPLYNDQVLRTGQVHRIGQYLCWRERLD